MAKGEEALILKEESSLKLEVVIEDNRASMPLAKYLELLQHLQTIQDELVTAKKEVVRLRKLQVSGKR